jgi:hypothetical protein
MVINGSGQAAERLKAQALAALQGQFTPINDPDVPLTDEPVTVEVSDVAFLGRLVVELWDNQAIIAISGADQRILTSAMKRLKTR